MDSSFAVTLPSPPRARQRPADALTALSPFCTRDERRTNLMPHETAFDHFLHILTLPDNIPIVGLMILLFFFTYLALREARKNDQLIDQGREDEILERMQD